MRVADENRVPKRVAASWSVVAVEDIEEVLARMHAEGAEPVGELEHYQDSYRLCYVRGPEGVIVTLAEQLS